MLLNQCDTKISLTLQVTFKTPFYTTFTKLEYEFKVYYQFLMQNVLPTEKGWKPLYYVMIVFDAANDQQQ